MDNDLVKEWNLFKEGDEHSFAVLFKTFLPSLYKYGMKFVQDEAFIEDCIQDLFVKIYNNRESLSSSVNPQFYLLFSLKNMIIDALSKKDHLIYFPPEELPFIATYQYSDEQDETDDGEETLKKFNQIIKMLSPRQKEAIYLRFQLNLSYEEISRLLGINYQSVRNLIHRSVSKIRGSMDLT